MEHTYRTKAETIAYFRQLAYEYEKEAHRNKDVVAHAKAEAYRIAAFEIERNMK